MNVGGERYSWFCGTVSPIRKTGEAGLVGNTGAGLGSGQVSTTRETSGFIRLSSHQVFRPPNTVYRWTFVAAFQVALKLTGPPTEPSALKSGKTVPNQ
jgi:hypothetical protein